MKVQIKEEISIESLLFYFPVIILLFILYYKVFRIAADVKEIKEILKEQQKERDGSNS